MRRVKIFNLITLALTFLALVPKMESQVMPLLPVSHFPPRPLHPLCLTQIGLVSYACGMLPHTRMSPPLPLAPPPLPDVDVGHRSHRRQGHKHWHGDRHTPQEENCCHWAREMDSQCVCEILWRLPLFLTRPLHHYSIMIGESCNVTYSCGGPI